MRSESQSIDWRERPLSIGEFEELWRNNRSAEIAEGFLLTLKDAEDISRKEKVEFLINIAYVLTKTYNIIVGESEKFIKKKKNLLVQALGYILNLVPVWDEELSEDCKRIVIYLLCGMDGRSVFSGRDLPAVYQGQEGNIKKFLHSLLNTKKKDGDPLWTLYLPIALVRYRMFEELVNYDLNTDGSLPELEELIFHSRINHHVLIGGAQFSYFDVGGAEKELMLQISEALKEDREPHALSVFLRLIAKKGYLDRIFS